MPRPMKPLRHGTRYRYTQGCRCDDCKNANTLYLRRRKERLLTGEATPAANAAPVSNDAPGPVQSAVTAELAGYLLSAERPGLAAIAVCLAQLLDNPRAVAAHPSAARELGKVLDTLSKGAQVRHQKLAAVRTMTGKDGA